MTKLNAYASVNKDVISTTEVIKTSFKAAFEKLDKDDFVVLENNRRTDKMVLINLKEYSKLLNKLEKMEEALFDKEAIEIIESRDGKYINASDLKI